MIVINLSHHLLPVLPKRFIKTSLRKGAILLWIRQRSLFRKYFQFCKRMPISLTNAINEIVLLQLLFEREVNISWRVACSKLFFMFLFQFWSAARWASASYDARFSVFKCFLQAKGSNQSLSILVRSQSMPYWFSRIEAIFCYSSFEI